jgi:hypothetical protein
MFVIFGDQKAEWQCHARLPFVFGVVVHHVLAGGRSVRFGGLFWG